MRAASPATCPASTRHRGAAAGLMPRRYRGPPTVHLLRADIDALLAAARRCSARRCGRRPTQTLIGLLAASGLRIGEAIKLDRSDVDLGAGRAADPRVQVRQVPPGAAAPHQHAGARDLRPAARPAAPAARSRPSSSHSRGACSTRTCTQTFPQLCRDAGHQRPPGDRRPAARPAPHLRGPHPARLVPRTARTCRPGSRRCRPTSVTSSPRPPTGTCRPPRSCSPLAAAPAGRRMAGGRP